MIEVDGLIIARKDVGTEEVNHPRVTLKSFVYLVRVLLDPRPIDVTPSPLKLGEEPHGVEFPVLLNEENRRVDGVRGPEIQVVEDEKRLADARISANRGD